MKTAQNVCYQWSSKNIINKNAMKKTMRITLLAIFSTCALSCLSDQDKAQQMVEENVYRTLTMQAKSILTNPSTYEFERVTDYRVNDSIRVFVQKFSGSNAFGVRDSKYAIGYFNINSGCEVEDYLIEQQASKEELKSVKAILNPR